MEETVRGMTIKVRISAPAGATIETLRDKVRELFAFAAKDPNQFGLFEKDQPKPSDE
jgi:hypothetical protein